MKLNIGYFADGQWSHKAFKKIIKDKSLKISFICVRFDTTDNTLKKYAKYYHIDYLKHKNINTNEFISIIKKYKCDLFVSMSFDQIFKKKIINLPKHKIINCHAGKLPFYRGRNILNWVLINDEKEFGITVHYVNEKIDKGDIILQKTFKISDKDDYQTLLKRSYVGCANILYEAIKRFKKAKPKGLNQNKIHPRGSYCSRRTAGDEILNWYQPSRKIFNFVRAICRPGPIARSFINKKEMKINKVKYIKSLINYKDLVGSILKISSDGFLVKTKDSFIKVIDYEYDGKIQKGDKFEKK